MQHYRDALVEVFSEFYGGDKQDMPGQYVDDTRIDSNVPYNNPFFLKK